MAIISIASTKGGVGKTSLAFSLAKDLGYRYATNDMSVVLNKYSKARYHPGKIPLYPDTVYDFGGFIDKRSDEILRQSDIIIIPTTNDLNSIMKSLITIKKFREKTLLVFANMIEHPNDARTIRDKIHEHFPNLAFTYMRRTKLLKNALETGMSATELYQLNNQTLHLYERAYKEYNKILRLFTTDGQYFRGTGELPASMEPAAAYD
jgi:cellulose biosynthesis protein BcsQ